MRPKIHNGDLVLVARANKTLASGDIVVYEHEKEKFNIIHRIDKIEDDLIYTKGDALPNSDLDPVRVNDIRGKVILVVPLVGLFILFLKRWRDQK